MTLAGGHRQKWANNRGKHGKPRTPKKATRDLANPSKSVCSPYLEWFLRTRTYNHSVNSQGPAVAQIYARVPGPAAAPHCSGPALLTRTREPAPSQADRSRRSCRRRNDSPSRNAISSHGRKAIPIRGFRRQHSRVFRTSPDFGKNGAVRAGAGPQPNVPFHAFRARRAGSNRVERAMVQWRTSGGKCPKYQNYLRRAGADSGRCDSRQ